jgi:hypothetical protein
MSAETEQVNAPQRAQERLVVSVSFGANRAEFSGTPEAVIQSVNNFVAKSIPEIDLARKLSLNFSTKELVDAFKDYIKITPEGPKVWDQERKLSDKDVVALQLVAQKIASETGNAQLPSLTLSSLQESTGLNPKSLSSRLSEMTKASQVVREVSDGTTTFKISTIGIAKLRETLSKKP